MRVRPAVELPGAVASCRYPFLSVVPASPALALPSLTEIDERALQAWLLERGEPAYRARQIQAAVAQGRRIDQMHEVPAGLRWALERSFAAGSLEEVRRWDADSGATTKRLYRMGDGFTVEAVLMRYPRRSTLCISSQVGCPIKCPFCATGQGPFGRNLRAAEIVDQAIDAARTLREEGRRLSHVVFMGMGEPLANLPAVLPAVRRIADPAWLGISPRRITVSTSGLVPRIDRLAESGLPVTLAISLHAARDELRDHLVPINRRYPLRDVVGAADRYVMRTGRRVSYEWVLLQGVNDQDRDALELIALLRRRLAHVNLIPFNPVDGTAYREPPAAVVRRFASRLEAAGIGVTVRDTRGRESEAACGQLRARTIAADPALR
ncbi:MAG: 23S rRNA (adenine(2503)-C(2))-methyltransferase RlmN [Candidatus Dormibacteraceae bacterium]